MSNDEIKDAIWKRDIFVRDVFVKTKEKTWKRQFCLNALEEVMRVMAGAGRVYDVAKRISERAS